MSFDSLSYNELFFNEIVEKEKYVFHLHLRHFLHFFFAHEDKFSCLEIFPVLEKRTETKEAAHSILPKAVTTVDYKQ